jgi:hypothetical protein
MTEPAECVESRRPGDKVADGVGCTQALVLIVVGTPDSGKGTQCAKLAGILANPARFGGKPAARACFTVRRRYKVRNRSRSADF